MALRRRRFVVSFRSHSNDTVFHPRSIRRSLDATHMRDEFGDGYGSEDTDELHGRESVRLLRRRSLINELAFSRRRSQRVETGNDAR